MSPITLAGLGWLVVIFDLRLGGYDVVVDALGWLLVMLACRRMQQRSLWFRWAERCAGVALVLSLLEYLAGLPGDLLLVMGYNVAFAATFFCQASGMAVCARDAGSTGVATQANVLRWTILGLNAAASIGIAAYYAGSDFAAATVAALVFCSLVCFVWFTALQLLVGARPDFDPQPSPA